MSFIADCLALQLDKPKSIKFVWVSISVAIKVWIVSCYIQEGSSWNKSASLCKGVILERKARHRYWLKRVKWCRGMIDDLLNMSLTFWDRVKPHWFFEKAINVLHVLNRDLRPAITLHYASNLFTKWFCIFRMCSQVVQRMCKGLNGGPISNN